MKRILIVRGEVHNVLAAMRQNARWASDSVSRTPDATLFRGFREVLRILSLTPSKVSHEKCHTMGTDDEELDVNAFISPFLAAIRSGDSGEANDVVTEAVLSALQTFYSHGMIDHPAASAITSEVADAIVHCRFDPSNAGTYEVVLGQIVGVLEAMVCSSASDGLSDESVVAMLQTAFHICLELTLSELLRKRAEVALCTMLKHLLSRLEYIVQCDTVEEEPKEEEKKELEEGDGTYHISMGSAGGGPGWLAEGQLTGGSATGTSGGGSVDAVEYVNTRGVHFKRKEDEEIKPYGMPAMIALLKFIASLVEPINADDMRLLGLVLLNKALDTQGVSFMQQEPLLDIVQNKLWANLLAALRTPNLTILAQALRLSIGLFMCWKEHLKGHFEALFSFILSRLSSHHLTLDDDYGTTGLTVGSTSSGPALSYEERELFLDHLGAFASIQEFGATLFVNYDTDPQCTDLFEVLCKFLSKSAFPSSEPLTSVHLSSLDALLGILRSIAARADAWGEEEGPLSVADIRARKYRKRQVEEGVHKFNHDGPQQGFGFLQSVHMLPTPLSPEAIAEFLHKTPRLDKRSIGEYMGKKGEENAAVLQAYVNRLNFKSVGFDGALREFLSGFRIPGESQMIERMVMAFANKFFLDQGVGQQVFKSVDAAFVLAYSVLMLNTDLHNTGIKVKMSEEEFVRNNRGINEGEDLPLELLSAIYTSVAKNEIVLPEEQSSAKDWSRHAMVWRNMVQHATDHALDFVLVKGQEGAFDRDMFVRIWGPSVAALSNAFDMAPTEAVMRQIQNGFMLVAKICARYNLSNVLDNVVVSMCKFSGLLTTSEVKQRRAMLFGRSRKAQVAARTAFFITRRYGNTLREGWRSVLDCIASMFSMGLLPDELVQLEDYHVVHADEGQRCLTPAPAPAPVQESRGFLSAVAGYLVFGSDAKKAEQLSAQEVEWSRAGRDCARDCSIGSVLSESKFLDVESLGYFVRALIIGTHAEADVATLFLEHLVTVSLHNRDRIPQLWPHVFARFGDIVDPMGEFHTLAHGAEKERASHILLERASVGLLRICIRLLHNAEVGEKLMASLTLFQALTEEEWITLAPQITAGIARLIRMNASFITSPGGWKNICWVLARAASHPVASTYAFEAISFMLLDPTCTHGILSDVHILAPVLQVVQSVIQWQEAGEQRSMQALELLFALHSRIRSVHQGEEVAASFWEPLMMLFSEACTDERVLVRNNALLCFQRALLVPGIGSLSAATLQDCFDHMLLPLLGTLVNKEMGKLPEMEETRLRVFGLMTRAFLHYLPQLVHLSHFEQMWLRVLAFAECYTRLPRNEHLVEAVAEAVKNMILVMSTSGLFVHPDPTKESPQEVVIGVEFWVHTWPVVHAFIPGLQQRLFGSVPLEIPERSVSAPLPSPVVTVVEEKESVVDSVREELPVPPSPVIQV